MCSPAAAAVPGPAAAAAAAAEKTSTTTMSDPERVGSAYGPSQQTTGKEFRLCKWMAQPGRCEASKRGLLAHPTLTSDMPNRLVLHGQSLCARDTSSKERECEPLLAAAAAAAAPRQFPAHHRNVLSCLPVCLPTLDAVTLRTQRGAARRVEVARRSQREGTRHSEQPRRRSERPRQQQQLRTTAGQQCQIPTR